MKKSAWFRQGQQIGAIMIMVLFLVSLIACSAEKQPQALYPGRVDYRMSAADEAFLDSLQRSTFQYFIHEINPAKGLVKDRSTKDSPATVAAMGWALPVWAIGAERGWISRDEAARLTLNMLRFLKNARQSPDPVATGYKGFYYHFLDMEEGLRYWNSELSSIDTAWLLGGVRFAVQYYQAETAMEQEIRRLGDELTFRVDWDFLAMPDSGKFAYTIAMGWKPEKGLHHLGWAGYNEAQYLYILAAGSGYGNAEKAYQSWLNNYNWLEPYPGMGHVVFPPLFGHQFTQCFLDLRGLVDAYMKDRGIDYFENSRRATYANRQYCIENPRQWKGYDSLTWGISAGDGPGSDYNFDDKRFHSYAGRGASGPGLTRAEDGTISTMAPATSIVFAPEIVLPTLRSWHERFAGKGLFGRYGMVDAFNLTANWFDEDYLGLDQGPIVIMIENYRSGLVWEYCMRDEVIQKGLDRLGFEKKAGQ